MVLGVYSYYNKVLQAFSTQFQLDDHPEEQVIYNVQRGVTARLVLEKVEDLKFLALYKLGTFDDESGEFKADKKLLLDLDNVIASYFAKKEVNENVGKEGSSSAA